MIVPAEQMLENPLLGATKKQYSKRACRKTFFHKRGATRPFFTLFLY